VRHCFWGEQLLLPLTRTDLFSHRCLQTGLWETSTGLGHVIRHEEPPGDQSLGRRATGSFEHEESLKRQIKELMAEFGAETYSIPPEFLEQVNRFLEQYEGPDRPHMARALGERRDSMAMMRRIFEENSLPAETREYVPKVIAAMIIGRHPEQYGFQRGE